MRVCDCYRQLEPIQLMVGECLGAKNKPRVDCEGDESRCLFYSDRRRKAKVVTNADLLRDMSDKELANHIRKIIVRDPWCDPPEDGCEERIDCEDCILGWLKAPAKEEEE